MTEIDDKTRAQVLRWALDEIPMDDDMQAALRGWIDDLDPPEPKFEDGDYALWTPGGARLLATRNATGGAVPWWVGFGSYTDDRVRVAFSRIEKLRIADDDEVIHQARGRGMGRAVPSCVPAHDPGEGHPRRPHQSRAERAGR